MDAYLDRPGAGQGGRPRHLRRSIPSPRSSSPGWTPRSTSGSRPSARPEAAVPGGRGRDRQRPAGLPGVRADLRRRPLGRPGGGRRQQAAPAVGIHRRQGPEVRRHPLRRRTRRPEHGEHRPGEDHRRGPRPRRHPRQHHRGHLRAGVRGVLRAGSPRHRPRTTSSRSWKPRAWRSSSRPGTSCWNRSARSWPRRSSTGTGRRRFAADSAPAFVPVDQPERIGTVRLTRRKDINGSHGFHRQSIRCGIPATSGCRALPGRPGS